MNRTAVPSQYQPQPALATERQVAFASSLLDEKDLFACPGWFDKVNAMDQGEYNQYLTSIKAKLPTLTKKRVSEIIDTLVKLPSVRAGDKATDRGATRANQRLEFPAAEALPAGRYAVRVDDVVKFYKVDRPTEGKWAGYVFVKAGKGGPHGEPEWVRMASATQAQVAQSLTADPAAAAQLYGQEIGECGVCGRTLTDETSRAYGIGPVCRAQTGW